MNELLGKKVCVYYREKKIIATLIAIDTYSNIVLNTSKGKTFIRGDKIERIEVIMN